MGVIDGVIPVRDLTTEEILYGARSTTIRYELLTHDSSTGLDSLLGTLDGVQPDGTLSWVASEPVKKSGVLNILDLPTAGPGLMRIADVNLVTVRIRPVLVIDELPSIPLGLYIVNASPESWAGTGRTYGITMNDKSTVLGQDKVDQTYVVTAGTVFLAAVSTVITSAGERIQVDGSDARALADPMSWPAGTSKLQIVNDLLSALNYNSLWVDGVGNFRATPYVDPGSRSIQYSMLNDETGQALVRELTDGENSIYLPDWSRDRVSYGVPNKVVAVQSGGGSGPALTGSAVNSDPASPYSYPSRGRYITNVLDSVDVPDFSADPDPTASTVAFLNAKAQQSLTASSAVQAAVSVKCLPIPVELLDAVEFASVPAGIDARHTVQKVDLELKFDGLMSLELQEVIS